MLFAIYFFYSASSFAFIFYYGSSFDQNSPHLKDQLHLILTSAHTPSQNSPDKISATCNSTDCYQHTVLPSYTKARQHLFGELHLAETNNKYSLVTFYCQKPLTNEDFTSSSKLGPLKIPDTRVINTEHVWPQSKFSSKFDTIDQKNNLHILLPVLSPVNSLRSNHPMGHVTQILRQPCDGAAYGKNIFDKTVFEPHPKAQGDVARALFYFSVRFNLEIDEAEEMVLRGWHQKDPPDLFEIWRNEQIFILQNDRNPFIDMPHLVDKIHDF